jgi:oxygen-dependent protoporphyrinogen oxidase
MRSEAERPLDAVIIGGGVSGLTCLWKLRRSGFDAVCVEANGRPGGSIRSHRRDGFLVEGAASCVQPTAELLELVREAGLERELVSVPPRLPRFVYRHGQLHPVPRGLRDILTTSLLSARSKYRLLAELWTPPRGNGDEESVETFVVRRFGRDVHEAVAAPFVAGTFAGDASKLSAQAVFPRLVALEALYGGVIRGLARGRAKAEGGVAQTRAMVSFREGLEALPLRLRERLGECVRLGVRAESIQRREAFVIALRRDREISRVKARAVVIATPAAAAAVALEPLARDASRALAEVEAPPLTCVSLAWPRSQIGCPLRGFGFLVAPGETVRILGSFWPSSVFVDRAPADCIAFTSFVGGAKDAQSSRLDEDALVEAVARDLRRIVAASGSPRLLSIDRHAHAIPQYVIGHHDRLRRVREGLAATPGLFVTGNFLAGMGIGDCVRQATTTAAGVAAFLRGSRGAPGLSRLAT